MLGTTLDDAAGEAFDKPLGYWNSDTRRSQNCRIADLGDPKRFAFARPMTDRPGVISAFRD